MKRAVVWFKHHITPTPLQGFFSLIGLMLLGVIGYQMFSWALIDADFHADALSACSGQGACWAIVTQRWQQFVYGFYPADAYWRVNSFFVLFLLVLGITLYHKRLFVKICALLIGALSAYVLLRGYEPFITLISTDVWGGFFLSVFLTAGGIIGAFPLAILLAMGRQSHLPIIKTLCVGFIEIIRGVPLISVLFMASFMLPLFLPEGVSFDKLMRALVGILIFQAAYLAEVIRGGLNGIPKGQVEAAQSLGLSYWQLMAYIILPQALRMVIPGIVNTFIALFKDTTLVMIIGLLDFLGIVQSAITDPKWIGSALEAYVFCAFVYWICCFSMSLYSKHLERKLGVAHQ